ncbi:DUF4259 domain-containing protein [Agreia bicolorata]|uniref:DUF4259 domain-containing protein n=1 Tax=Agreia bicolorata TaxID=110935 RepID=A0ABR5CGC0_9MICO|nr:DUF4259 domain-containing protein [Agreia bicolorata]KJC64666.1 hypothetical protein TZ00_10100 [Agreia bicolorata]
MGTWSGQPFRSDSASDWAYDLADASDWSVVRDALTEVIGQTDIDADDAAIAIAAAEVVAHGLDRPTQTDAYTESVGSFVQRVGRPDAELVAFALDALAAAGSAESELTELWQDEDPDEWLSANAALKQALDAGLPGHG